MLFMYIFFIAFKYHTVSSVLCHILTFAINEPSPINAWAATHFFYSDSAESFPHWTQHHDIPEQVYQF